MPNIPGNRIFFTDNSCSTLVWVEQNIVIEYYLLFPNLETPLHSHPFKNQMIFIEGDLIAYRQEAGKPETKFTVKFSERLRNHVGQIMPIGGEHGFTTGARGAVIYNIQIWPQNIVDPVSATIAYKGKTMGPLHQKLISNFIIDHSH